MFSPVISVGARIRVLSGRLLARLGFSPESFLTLLAMLIGVVTAAAAVGFHLLIQTIRNQLYGGLGPYVDIYGKGVTMLIALPAIGGLAVGLISIYVFRIREGHGVVDIIESVIRARGVIRPLAAVEKIITSAITIGTGGSAGAEGPILQIGSGIASGIGQLFRVARQHMPILIGCGSAAGISAIFNAPIGGVFFALEVILQDFSIRTFTPVVLASVIANVSTKAIFVAIAPHESYEAIFAMPAWQISGQTDLTWGHISNFVMLGLMCGAVGVALTRMMYWSEAWFGRMRLARWVRPGVGGVMLGILGVAYVMVFGWLMLGREKPVSFADYPLPAFYSDGYGVIRQLVQSESAQAASASTPAAASGATSAFHTNAVASGTTGGLSTDAVASGATGGLSTSAAGPAEANRFYERYTPRQLLALLGALCIIKLLATCATLGSGGSGGIIAPSLFLGATAGGFMGLVLRHYGGGVEPNFYAMVGMGAVLAAVVHAPLAAILILLELTQDYKIILPAMLASIVATTTARLLFRDSIYTLGLRVRGIRVGTSADLTLLRRLTVEQVDLDPACMVHVGDSFESLLDLAEQTGAAAFVATDARGSYVGMVSSEDMKAALMQVESRTLLLVQDLVRPDVPPVQTSDDLAGVLDMFAKHDVDRLPVTLTRGDGRVIGLVSRSALLKRYQQGLGEGA